MAARRITLILLFITASFNLIAQDYLDHIIFKELSYDLVYELDHYDGVNYTPEQKSKIVQSFDEYLAGKGKNPLTGKGATLSEVSLEGKAFSSAREELILKEIKDLASISESHAIKDLNLYLENRLGKKIANLAESGRIELNVHAGNVENLANSFKLDSKNLKKIPSFYEAWGIEKYIDVSTLGDKPRVFLNIPPIKEYSEHYKRMLTHLKSPGKVILNNSDGAILRNKFKEAVSFVFDELKVPAQSNILMGYYNQFEDVLKTSTHWELISMQEISGSGEIGIKGKIFKLHSKLDPKIRTEVVALGANMTLWGEGTTFLSEAIMEKNPRSIYFMGSAGSLSPNTNYYDLSIPQSFKTQASALETKNVVFQMSQYEKTNKQYLADIKWGGSHGHSFSPIQQEKNFLTAARKLGITSIDVEQSLVAEAVQRYNTLGHNTAFGAINIVTDKPNVGDISHQADLDKIDVNLKNKARLSAVELALDFMHEHEKFLQYADDVRKEMILKSMPGISASQISIKNGIGRIDANKDVKMSYYVNTLNFKDPLSKIEIIPLATSRFDRYNYHTEEWWDKYGEAYTRKETVPMEDPRDVQKYLDKHGLSTNPDVLTIEPNKAVTKTKLKNYLLNKYLDMYKEGDNVLLFRGIGKATELDVWNTGTTPRGVRYWTPNASYGWRYARKRESFITHLVAENAPVASFKVPKNEFINMVQNNEIVLGVELPKSAHNSFDNHGFFKDSLTGGYYLGDGGIGIEHEIRFRRRGRDKINNYYTGGVSVEALSKDRIAMVRTGYKRLVNIYPTEANILMEEMKTRIRRIKEEEVVLRMMRDGESTEKVLATYQKMRKTTLEMANTDFESFDTFVRNYKPNASCASFYMPK